jgi:hypothetical protein
MPFSIGIIPSKVFGAVGRRPDGGFHWGNDGFVIKVGTPTPVQTIEKQKTGEKDDITGKPVTKNAANAAKKGKMLFKLADAVKEKPGYNQGINNK